MKPWALLIVLILAAGTAGLGAPSIREDVFEFVQKPAVAREGDRVTVSFETKGPCDVTIAVEDAQGQIVRHLACGVLGPNAPAPFLKNQLKQAVTWDGKSDKGEYVDDKDSLTVRVSLGLKARYERNLMWCPKKRGPTVGTGLSQNPMLMAPAPEGVYVYGGEFAGEHVQLYDHEGNYVRTIHPFPAGQLKNVAGLKMLPGSDPATPNPVRWHSDLVTTLTAADSNYGGTWPMAGSPAHHYGNPTLALAVRGNRLALAAWRLNRLATDGSTGGLDLTGPGVTFKGKLRALHEFPGGIFDIGPRTAAIDPKGEWLYLSGYAWNMAWNQDGLHGVVRLRLDGKEPPEAFAGDMQQNAQGSDDGHLSLPLGVTCDAAGRIHVCDYMNDRIQVFDASKKLLKTLRTYKPVHVDIHPRTGELFVFSWLVGNDRMVREYSAAVNRHEDMKPIPPTLTRYEAIDWAAAVKDVTPQAMGSCPLPIGVAATDNAYMGVMRVGLHCRVAVDFWAPEPRVWISEGGQKGVTWEGNIRTFSVEKSGLKLVRDFSKDVHKEDPQPRTPYHGRQRLYFDHRHKKLYVGEQFPDPLHIKAFADVIQLDPITGKSKVIPLPFDCEDMAFDMDGNAYLRTQTQIARYDPTSWREVPFDYGEEKAKVSYSGARSGRHAERVNSMVECRLENNSSSQFYGMWVSPRGYVVITGCHRTAAESRTDAQDTSTAGTQRYEPQIYAGRPWGSLVHIFDRHGKMVYDDALPGSDYFQGIAMDMDDNLYIQHSGMPPGPDGKYPPNVQRNACTLIKLKPRSRFLMPSGGIIPLPAGARPDRPPDFLRQGSQPVWIEKAEWMYGGVGLSTKGSPSGNCHCFGNSRFAFDYFARSFVAELDRYRVTALDSNGNVILRIGRYGNVDDGKPLEAAKASPAARSTGGDEVALMQPLYLAAQTDQRLFVADIGNYRIFSVKLDYHAEEKLALKDAREQKR